MADDVIVTHRLAVIVKIVIIVMTNLSIVENGVDKI